MAFNPVLGRWMQADPAGYADGPSLYEYERSIPTTLLDPSGRNGIRRIGPPWDDNVEPGDPHIAPVSQPPGGRTGAAGTWLQHLGWAEEVPAGLLHYVVTWDVNDCFSTKLTSQGPESMRLTPRSRSRSNEVGGIVASGGESLGRSEYWLYNPTRSTRAIALIALGETGAGFGGGGAAEINEYLRKNNVKACCGRFEVALDVYQALAGDNALTSTQGAADEANGLARFQNFNRVAYAKGPKAPSIYNLPIYNKNIGPLTNRMLTHSFRLSGSWNHGLLEISWSSWRNSGSGIDSVSAPQLIPEL